MSTVLGFPDATSPTPETGLLWLTEGSGSTRDKKVPSGTLVTDLFPTSLVSATVAMSAASALSGTETLPIVQTTAKKVPLSKIVPGMRSFSSLMEIFPPATPTGAGSIIAQNRMSRHVGLGDKALYADLSFHWSATFAAAGSCGWTIPDDMDTLAPELDSALREFWGVGVSAEWTYPYLQGTLIVPGGVYPLSIWNEGGSPSNSKYRIWNWTATEEAALYAFGQINIHVPGTP